MVMTDILRVRDDFTRLRNGRSYRTDAFTLRMAPSSETLKAERETTSRIGITVSKHCSKKAVERNRIKRRLREVIREIWPEHSLPAHDYVLIARIEALNIPYAELQHSARRALKKLHG